MARDWEEHYATGNMPWDRVGPDPELVKLIESGRLPKGRALDVGCGTGTIARFLANNGYHVLGVDVSSIAIERANEGAAPRGGSVEYRYVDFLAESLNAGIFDLVFDRGCFHVFDEPTDQARYAERVAECLAPEGRWVSLIGSTEGAPRGHGPPRRSARDITNAVEPALEILELQGMQFELDETTHVPGWVLIAGRRALPAQPSTVLE